MNIDEVLGRVPVELPPPDPDFDKWSVWSHALGSDVIHGLFLRRAIWRGLNEIWRSGDLPRSVLFDFMAGTYTDAQILAVRRVDDRDKRTRSLRQILQGVISRPEVLSRERLVGAYEWGHQNRGEDWFNWLAGTTAAHIPASMAAADLKRLGDAVAPIKRYADKAVAHSDAIPPDAIPRFDDLDHAIDVIGDVFHRWHVILTGENWAEMVPVPQDDWAAPLRVAWLSESDPAPDLPELGKTAAAKLDEGG